MVGAEEEVRGVEVEHVVVSAQDLLWPDFVYFLRHSRLIKELTGRKRQESDIDTGCHSDSNIQLAQKLKGGSYLHN
jgi:hypothetical protein